MRFLGVTETCDLLALYLELQAEGHEVRVAVTEPLAGGTGEGLIDRVVDWRSSLDWVGDDGIIIFESVSEDYGAIQDEIRGLGYHVIGGSAFGDRLENDRAFAQALLAELGFPAGHVHEFADTEAAIAFIAKNPARYVLKISGPDHASHDNYVGLLRDGRDVSAMLEANPVNTGTRFILMDFIEGVEVGVGAYFDGTEFLEPACLDWEHKRFFAGDMGELTGEMGTVATFEQTGGFFRRTLKLVAPLLRGKGHIGYVNLNAIVNEAGIWPLEFTCRFGYPGFAVLSPLQRTKWGQLFARMTGLGSDSFKTEDGWAVGVLITTPPFPWSRHEVNAPVGLPIIMDALDRDDRSHIHFGEVGRSRGNFVTAGLYGWTMVVTGVASTIAEAQSCAYLRAEKIVVPNGRYRLDIGDKLVGGELERSKALGIFGG
ncbi:phosphoribosylamine--glycine ligase [Sphingomonas antarctica]|uniref:hypothetical protein n=1 Tax=Sphingomonas antarctica TaxID=2040274 RepID=UPI0039E8199F